MLTTKSQRTRRIYFSLIIFHWSSVIGHFRLLVIADCLYFILYLEPNLFLLLMGSGTRGLGAGLWDLGARTQKRGPKSDIRYPISDVRFPISEVRRSGTSLEPRIPITITITNHDYESRLRITITSANSQPSTINDQRSTINRHSSLSLSLNFFQRPRHRGQHRLNVSGGDRRIGGHGQEELRAAREGNEVRLHVPGAGNRG